MATQRLTDSAIRSLKPGTYRDSGLNIRGVTLELRVNPNGKRVFDLLYRDDSGKRCRVGARNFGANGGEWHATDFSIAAARRTAKEAWRQISSGRDFVNERREAKDVLSVKDAAEAYIRSYEEAGGKDDRNVRGRISAIRLDLKGDALASLKVDKVTEKDIVAWQDRVQARAAAAPQAKDGKRARSAARERLATIFNYIGVTPNPAELKRAHATKRQRVERNKHDARALYTEEELGSITLAVLSELQAGWIPQDAADLILMLVLTSQRSGEVINARWNQIDRERGVWHIPGDQPGNKSGRPHSQPLPDAVMKMINRRWEERKPDGELVFPSPKSNGSEKPYAMTYVYRYGAETRPDREKSIADRHGLSLTVHDLRRLAATWCDFNVRYFWAAPFLLNHVTGQRNEVDRRYARGDMTEVIREARQAFENWTFSLLQNEGDGTVVKITKERA